MGPMRRASKPVAASCAVVAGLATIVVILLVTEKGARGASERLVSGPLSLEYSSPWQQAKVVESVPYGLEIGTPRQLRRDHANLWAGKVVSGAAVPGGLPPRFGSNVHGIPARQKVELHGVPAMRYAGVVEPGATRFNLYVLATEESDYAILCTGATWRDADRCERLMQTAHLDDVKVIQPGADTGLSQQLERLVTPLKQHAQLLSGRTAAESVDQIVQRARKLHRLYRDASSSIADLPVMMRDRAAVAALANALAVEAAELDRLKESAAAHREARYEAAALSVEATSRTVRSDLRRLQHAGFSGVPLLPVLAVPPLSSPEALTAPQELVEAEGEKSGGAVVESEGEVNAQAESEGGSEQEWEAAEEVGGSSEGATGRGEPKAEPAEPVEAQGAR
jgi:hypothetical protein